MLQGAYDREQKAMSQYCAPNGAQFLISRDALAAARRPHIEHSCHIRLTSTTLGTGKTFPPL
jgi:hypothetical protein